MSETHSARRTRARTAAHEISESKESGTLAPRAAAARHIGAVEAAQQCSPTRPGDAIAKTDKLAWLSAEVHR